MWMSCFNDKMCILVDWSWKQPMLKKIYHNNFALNNNSLFKTLWRTFFHLQACMIHYKYSEFSRSGSVLHHIPLVVATFSAFELYELVSSTVRRIFHFPNVFTLHIWVWCQIRSRTAAILATHSCVSCVGRALGDSRRVTWHASLDLYVYPITCTGCLVSVH